MRFTDITIIDPLMSVGVALFIFVNAFKNLKEVLDLFLEKIPHNVDLNEIKTHVLAIDGVKDVHHIHIWSMDGYRNYATLHVVTNSDFSQIKSKVREELKEHGIHHVTLELETENEQCQEEKCCAGLNDSASHHHHHHHHH